MTPWNATIWLRRSAAIEAAIEAHNTNVVLGVSLALVVAAQCESVQAIWFIMVEQHCATTILTLAIRLGNYFTYIFTRQFTFKLPALVFLDAV